jgi:PAS domain S-box-containing protein
LNPYAIISIVAAITSFFIANFIYFRNPKNSLNRTIAIFSTLIALMALFEFAYRLAETPESAFIWLKLSALWPLIPAVIANIALVFTRRSHILKLKISYLVIYGPALLFVFLGLGTNLFVGPPVLEYWGWTYSIPADETIYDLFAVWTVVVSFLSALVVFLHYFQSDGMEKKQSLYISIGIFMPLVLSLITDYILRGIFIKIPEFTQTLLTLGLVFIAYGVWRYNFPILTPSLASEKIVSTMPNFLILSDHRGRITKINESITSVLGYKESDLMGKPFYELFAPTKKIDLKKVVYEGKKVNMESVICTIKNQEMDVFLNISPIFSILKDPTGFVIIGTDLTETKKALHKIIENEFKFRSVVEQTSDGVTLSTEPGKIIDWNKSMEKITGIKKEEADTKLLSEILYELNPEEEKEILNPSVLQEQFEDVFNNKNLPDEFKFKENDIMRADGSLRSVTINNFFVEKSDPLILCTVVQDITDRKEFENSLKTSLAEKEVLLREIHHRVKNNLQIISSLLNLQTVYIDDQEALNLFKESQNRVKSMSMIHESLYQSRDLAHIDFSIYLSRLCNELLSSYGVNINLITLKTDLEKIFLDINTAIPCGLIITELFTNSIKYAFPEGRKGIIDIKFQLDTDDNFILEVSDNGVGFPDDIDFENTKSLGMRLVSSLVDQLDGTIELDNSSGTRFIIKFHELEYESRV